VVMWALCNPTRLRLAIESFKGMIADQPETLSDN
jgi:hypothetical protein